MENKHFDDKFVVYSNGNIAGIIVDTILILESKFPHYPAQTKYLIIRKIKYTYENEGEGWVYVDKEIFDVVAPKDLGWIMTNEECDTIGQLNKIE